MGKQKKVNLLSTFCYCMKLSYQTSRFYTIFRLVYGILFAILNVTIAYIGKIIIDKLVEMQSGISHGSLILLLLYFTGLSMLIVMSGKVNEYVVSMHNDILKNTITMKLMDISSEADMEFFDSAQFYDAFEALKQDTYEVISIVWYVMELISCSISVCSALFVLAKSNILFGVLIIAATVPTAVVSRKYAKELYYWSLEHMDEVRKMGYIDYLVSDKAYAADIRLYNIGNYLKEYYKKIWTSYLFSRKKVNKRRAVLNALLSSMPWICIFFILTYITNKIINGNGTIGDYSLYIGMLTTLSRNTLVFLQCATEIYENKLKVENIKNFNKYESKIKDEGTQHIGDELSLEFRNVSFRYPGCEEYVLKNINFQINHGEHIGIVGLNGSGKSTLIKLILRFYDVTSGEILVNGKNIKEYPINVLRSIFSTFFQQFVIFAFSLEDNITMFDSDGSEEKMLKALEYSNALDIYKTLNEDKNTFLTRAFEASGVELSGGQRQKIALARAFYREGKMVILDEPSAALDPEAEYQIFEMMKQLCEKKTAIFISHRLSNIVFADKVIMMEKGRVIEQGTHGQLMKRGNRYAKLFECQAKQYEQLARGDK